MDQETRSELTKVENLLGDIRSNTANPWWKNMLNGLLYGSGVVVGTIGGIAVLGWALSIFGVIPGFDILAAKLQSIMMNKY